MPASDRSDARAPVGRYVMIESNVGLWPWPARGRPANGRAISLMLAVALVLAIAAAAAAPLVGTP
jgi:hypothetical protein